MKIIQVSGTAQNVEIGQSPVNSPALQSLYLLYRNTATPAVAATGTVTFTAVPANGDLVTISDGATSVIYEFNSGAPGGGHTAVAPGAAKADSANNLIATIVASGQTLTPTLTAGTNPVVNLTNTTAGVAGNVAITKTGTAVSVTGMSGGAAAVASTPTYAVTALMDDEGLTLGTYAVGNGTLSAAAGTWTLVEVAEIKLPQQLTLNLALAQATPGFHLDLMAYFAPASGAL